MLAFPLPYYITHAEFRYRLNLDPVMTVLAAFALTQIPVNSDGTWKRRDPEPAVTLIASRTPDTIFSKTLSKSACQPPERPISFLCKEINLAVQFCRSGKLVLGGESD